MPRAEHLGAPLDGGQLGQLRRHKLAGRHAVGPVHECRDKLLVVWRSLEAQLQPRAVLKQAERLLRRAAEHAVDAQHYVADAKARVVRRRADSHRLFTAVRV